MSTQPIPPTCDCAHPSDCTHAVAAAWGHYNQLVALAGATTPQLQGCLTRTPAATVPQLVPTTITPASTSNIPANSRSALREVTNNTTKVGKAKRQQQTQSGGKKKKAKPGASSSTQVPASNTVPDPSTSTVSVAELPSSISQ
ncbi:hypothetical protein FRC03_005701 [Tulasnella sp. 419]|nr:hypothetical protein FRC03_005701 [Tulasnella sp. 419]